MASGKNYKRRTQIQRSELTRNALLKATIECLLELGYAKTTSRAISRRAGVSQGAQQHYYPTRSHMIHAAIIDMTRQIVEEFITQLDITEKDEYLIAQEIIDQLWVAHNLPIARAVYDVMSEARDDVEVAYHISKTLNSSVLSLHALFENLLPKASRHPKFLEWLMISETLMRGTVMISMIPGAKGGYAEWPLIRKHLLEELFQGYFLKKN
ncbi:TetR/AcrR family transcriptional regulator [Acinetobacter junii]|uniref:TetR/AcrR family transcriptional regulator n=1 Tax=Acinetobacter junii TaxID=40215 RepID=UPI001F201B1B|nr:TetR/AcrR family transcriptional regulator [Acinetobacter junii]UOB53396.1 TetR/AcrR family transcriptional regulator [Acinetobacter junii]